jgi:hypothetical protein
MPETARCWSHLSSTDVPTSNHDPTFCFTGASSTAAAEDGGQGGSGQDNWDTVSIPTAHLACSTAQAPDDAATKCASIAECLGQSSEHNAQQGGHVSTGTEGVTGLLPAESTAGMPAGLDGSKETEPVEDGRGAPRIAAEGLQPNSDGWEVEDDDDDAWNDHDEAADACPAVPLLDAPCAPAVAAASAPDAAVTADAAALSTAGTDDLSSESRFDVTVMCIIAGKLKQELRRLESTLGGAETQLGKGDHESVLPAPGLAADREFERHEGLESLLKALPAHVASLTVAVEGVIAEKGSLAAQVKELEVCFFFPTVVLHCAHSFI